MPAPPAGAARPPPSRVPRHHTTKAPRHPTTKKVPSDLRMGGLAGRHATAPSAELGLADGFRLPSAVARNGSLSNHPRRPSKPAARCGLSLPRGGCPFADHLCGIDVPGLHLHRTAECVPTRPLLRSSVPFPGNWPAQGLVATHPVSSTVPRLSAPLRDLSIPPDRRSLRFAARKLAFAGRPLSVPPRNGRIAPAALDHRSRFAASRVARQLRKSLGTSIIVHWERRCRQYGKRLS